MFRYLQLLNGEEFKLHAMRSIVICIIPNILYCYGMRGFIKLYKLNMLEVLNALSLS
jgi:hypothetical protein